MMPLVATFPRIRYQGGLETGQPDAMGEGTEIIQTTPWTHQNILKLISHLVPGTICTAPSILELAFLHPRPQGGTRAWLQES